MAILTNAEGGEFFTDSPIEVVNFQARGWRIKPEPVPAPAVKPHTTKSEGKNVDH